MKNILLLGLLMICSEMSFGLPLQKGGKKTMIIQTKIYCDHCAKCESCKARIENTVYALKGIRMVELNPKNMTIKVIYKSTVLTEDRIRQQVASAGFDADNVKASAEQLAALDDCCQKR